jgi:hypothetical protein
VYIGRLRSAAGAVEIAAMNSADDSNSLFLMFAHPLGSSKDLAHSVIVEFTPGCARKLWLLATVKKNRDTPRPTKGVMVLPAEIERGLGALAFFGGWHADPGMGVDEELPGEGRIERAS